MKISTGNADFDEFLNGGYETDVITTLYGPAGSGKSNLCMLAAVEQAKKGKKVIFIDTEGGFSADRLKQLCDEDFSRNILVLRATDFYEQQRIFNKLLQYVKGELGLIVVDSMTMLYRLEMGTARQEEDARTISILNKSMAKELRILSEISTRKNVPILITNQVYSDFTKNLDENGEKVVHMVGGDLLKYWSKCIIELKRDRDKRRLILRKHRSMPEKDFIFYITEKGISKAGFRLF